MPWNWELPSWPNFIYEHDTIALLEKRFLVSIGKTCAHLKTLTKEDYTHFLVEILTTEGVQSSRIEGEILDRESLQSSIQKQFGLKTSIKRIDEKASAMANLLINVYASFDKPLTHKMLKTWHSILFKNSDRDVSLGNYRTHSDPMQIISNRLGSTKVFFEAPSSERIQVEMELFIEKFNTSQKDPILARAALLHVYFESIHPFEDGNGRIGRLLIEKILSQGAECPILIAVSKVLEARKKEYYAALERCNRTLEVSHWIQFFAEVVLQAQEESMQLLLFLIEKAKLLTGLKGKLNERQEKALLRMFSEGPNGFKGGLSAEKYIAMTKCSRATATRDLSDLVQMGGLVRTGELRHTRYWLPISKITSI